MQSSWPILHVRTTGGARLSVERKDAVRYGAVQRGAVRWGGWMDISVGEICDAVHRGDLRFAMWVMRHLTPESGALFRNHPDPAVQLCYLRARANTHRLHEIYRPCPILGPAGPTLRPRQRALIENILSAHWMDWQRGVTPPPLCRGIFQVRGRAQPVDLGALRVVTVFAQRTSGNPQLIENDFYVHFRESGREAGVDVHAFAGDDILYCPDLVPSKPRGERSRDDALQELTAFLEARRPDIVIADGNFFPTANTVDDRYWAEQKARLGFRLAICVGDCYDDSTDIRPWLRCADLILVMNDTAGQVHGLPNAALIPSLPIAASLFDRTAPKDIGLSCIGSESRNRVAWLMPLQVVGLPLYVKLHDRTAERAPDFATYCNIMSRSKMIFNNGFVTPYVNIQTARFYEAIVCGSVVLDEIGTSAFKYFSEYIHYIPISNIDQLIAYAQFLIQNEDWRLMIANSARQYWNENYSSVRFWTFLANRLL